MRITRLIAALALACDQSATNGFGIRFDGFEFVKTSVGVAFSW